MWEESWDDENTDSEFARQLRAELETQAGAGEGKEQK